MQINSIAAHLTDEKLDRTICFLQMWVTHASYLKKKKDEFKALGQLIQGILKHNLS